MRVVLWVISTTSVAVKSSFDLPVGEASHARREGRVARLPPFGQGRRSTSRCDVNANIDGGPMSARFNNRLTLETVFAHRMHHSRDCSLVKYGGVWEVDVDPVPMASLSEETSVVRPVRAAASGPCRCSRHSCWHMRECRSRGSVRIIREPAVGGVSNGSIVLCRECAAPTQRKRIA